MVIGTQSRTCFFQDGQIHSLSALTKSPQEDITRFTAHQTGGVWLVTSKRLIQIMEDGQVQQMDSFSVGKRAIVVLEDTAKQDWFFYEDKIIGKQERKTVKINWPQGFQLDPKQVKVIASPDGKFWIWGEKIGTWWFDPQTLNWTAAELAYPQQDGLISKFSFDKQGKLWGTNGKGVMLFGKEGKLSHHIFPDTRVMNLFFDKHDHLWISTASEGLKMVRAPVLGTLKWQKMNGLPGIKITAMAKDSSDRIWMGFQNGSLAVLTGDQIHAIYFEPQQKISQAVQQLWVEPDGKIWVAGAYGLHAFSNLHQVSSYPIPDIKSMLFDQKGNCYVGTSSHVWFISKDQLNAFPPQHISQHVPPIRFDPIFQKSLSFYSVPLGAYAMTKTRDQIKIGNAGGSWILGDTLKADRLLEKVPINFIFNQADTTYWFGTGGKGLWVFANGKMKYIGTADDLSGDHIRHIVRGKSGRIWVATSTGIDLFEDSNHLIPKHPSILDPLMRQEVFCLIEHDRFLYAGTNEGLFRLSLDALSLQGERPISHLEHIEVMGKNVGLPREMILAANENNISLHLKTILLTGHELLSYRYRLLGAFDEFDETHESEIRFFQLPAGSYRFECYPVHPSNLEHTAMIQYDFIISPRWYERTFVQISFIILIIISISSIAWWRWQEGKKTLDLKNRILEVKQQALLAQINPHFIFNVMNAIQAFISEGDPISANQVLVRISRLIRKVLDYARIPSLSLQEEIEFLELYFSLEAMRFSEDVQLIFHIDPSINPNQTYIPSMLLQPIVENALRHAFPNPYHNAYIKVSFTPWGEHLQCSIRDNGIGRVQAAVYKAHTNKNSHISHGLALTQERMAIFTQRQGKNFNLEIEDLKNKQGKPMGTLVNIKLPRL